MDLMELVFISLGTAVAVYNGAKLLLFSRILFPKLGFPLSKNFFASMGEWAGPTGYSCGLCGLPGARGHHVGYLCSNSCVPVSVVTGASEGIGRAYAFALAKQGMNVVIMSRTKARLDKVAKEIGEITGQTVKVIKTDFINESVFSEIEDQLKDLNIGVLVNNVGMLPTAVPGKFLECEELDKTITKVINCNVKTMAKMCKIILPGMVNRQKGVIVNISSGIASIPFPLYTLYAASKVFVERFSQGLQAEYRDKGIIIQTVAPFGVSTRMAAYQRTNIVTLSPEDFVKSSLQYVQAGDRINGSVCHTVLGWILQCIPLKFLYTESVLCSLKDYIKKQVKTTAKHASTSASGEVL